MMVSIGTIGVLKKRAKTSDSNLLGATLKDFQESLGNKSMSMVLRYAHLTQEHRKAAVNLLKDLTSIDPKNATVTKVSQKEKGARLSVVTPWILLVPPA